MRVPGVPLPLSGPLPHPSPLPLALALLVVLAGCSLPVSPADLDDPVGPDPAADAGPSTTASTPTVDPDNPWREAELAVALRTAPGDDRDYGPLVRESLEFWSANAERYAGYPVAFRGVEREADADLVVSFVDRVEGCENVTDSAGCAPVPTSPASLDRPETVEVRRGLSDASTLAVLNHELGHALGLDHDDEPQPLMAPTARLTTLPQPNATERVLPWRDPTLSVYVAAGNASDTAAVREQVDHALAYFDRGAEGTVPDNVTVVTTRNRSAADVVVRFGDRACGRDKGSCASRSGLDPDGDGAVEFYTRVDIALAGIDADATAWHVGYWLGYALGFDDEGDWPPPLRDASAGERRSEWWTEG